MPRAREELGRLASHHGAARHRQTTISPSAMVAAAFRVDANRWGSARLTAPARARGFALEGAGTKRVPGGSPLRQRKSVPASQAHNKCCCRGLTRATRTEMARSLRGPGRPGSAPRPPSMPAGMPRWRAANPAPGPCFPGSSPAIAIGAPQLLPAEAPRLSPGHIGRTEPPPSTAHAAAGLARPGRCHRAATAVAQARWTTTARTRPSPTRRSPSFKHGHEQEGYATPSAPRVSS